MAGLTTSALRDAAARVSSDAVGSSRTSAGARSRDAEWAAIRDRTARAIVADPDMVTYFAYLVSNRACALAQEAAALLSDMVVAVEGQKYAQAEIEEPVRLQRVMATTSTRTSFSGDDVARIVAEADAYVSTVAPQIARKNRVQARGSEAASTYASKRAGLVTVWRRLRSALDAVMAQRQLAETALRDAALQTPVRALDTTTGLRDPARLTDFVVQLAAAAAAVAAMGRPVDLRVRLRTGADPFPEGATAAATIADGLVTEVTPSTSPLELGVRSGDTVASGAGTATVLTVTSTTLTLASSTIESLDAGVLVTSTAYDAWEALVEDLQAVTAALPGAADLLPALQSREGPEAARMRALMEYAAGLAAVLDEATADALSALERVGGAAPAPSGEPAAALLRAFAPLFASRTQKAGDRVLSDLEAAGFDYAVELLYRGDIGTFLSAPASQMSRTGRLADATRALNVHTGGEP